MARQYKRDRNGRFSSTGGGGRAAKPKATGGTLAARSSLKGSRQKLASKNTSAQRGAVTRASNKLTKQQQANQVKLQGLRKGVGTIAKPKGMKPNPKAAEGLKKAKPKGGERGARARAIKAMSERKGTVAGKNFADGQARETMSLKEMRSAVIARVKGMGKLGMADIAMSAGTGVGMGKITKGRMPRTRGEWERAYKAMVTMPQSERGRASRPGVINGIDIHKNFRPWAVFGLNPKTASVADVNSAFKRLARTAHPDVGGRRKDFERLQKMRESVLATMPKPKAAKSSRKKKGAAAPRPSGPRALPAARK